MHATSALGLSSSALGATALTVKQSSSPEETGSLHRRLADESAERDATKLALQRTCRTVDFYRQRLIALTGSGPAGPEVASANLPRVKEIIHAIETEVRALPSNEQALQEFQGGQSPRQGYDVLRQSLEEAQRRCESLNCDMVYQAEANEELVEALCTVKDANKRLLEQIRFQTDEIAQLTEQRIGDEERIDKLTRKHHADHGAFWQNLQRQIAGIKTQSGEEYSACSRRLVDKLRYLRTKIEIIGQDAGRLHQEQQRMRMDVSTMVDAMQAQLRAAERDISVRCAGHLEACAKRQQVSEEAVADLEEKLTAGRDLRHNEGLSWGHRHAMLFAEREDVEERTSRDLGQLSSQLQALERTLSTERHTAAAERPRMERLSDETQQRHLELQREHDQMQRELVRLETAQGAAECDIRAKEQSTTEFRRQIRESDDALAAAVSGNEHLRDQMEEQRRRFQEKNEADLSDARAAFEQKFNDVRLAQDSDVASATRQLQDMEEAVEKDEEALQAVRAQAGVVTSEFESLNRDVQIWRSQTDAAKASRGGCEKEFKESRQTFAAEKLRLQAAIERLGTLTTSTEDEIKRTWDHIEEFRCLSSSRETEQVTRTGAAESLVHESQEHLANLKKRYLDAVDAKNRADSEVASTRQRAHEWHAAMELDLENKTHAAADENQRMADQLAVEHRTMEQAKEQLEREKENSVSQLRRVQEESRSKLSNAERDRIRIEETCRADCSGAGESVAQQQKYTDALEHDLHRLRYLLTESEANLTWVRQEVDREEREAGGILRQLQNEAKQTSIDLEKAVKTEDLTVRQIEEATQRNNVEQMRMRKELELIKHSTVTEQSDADARIHRARADLDLDFHGFEDRQRDALNAEKQQEEALENANTQLRSFLNEQSSTSGGLSHLHDKLETHIQRLQRHTEDLRRDIHSSAAAAGPPALTASSAAASRSADLLQRSSAHSPTRPSPTQALPLED